MDDGGRAIPPRIPPDFWHRERCVFARPVWQTVRDRTKRLTVKCGPRPRVRADAYLMQIC